MNRPPLLSERALAQLLAGITRGLTAIPELPATGWWLLLDETTRGYRALAPGDVSGWSYTAEAADAARGGLTDAQFRAAGIDPADVVDVATIPGSRAAAAAAADAADAELWQTDPPGALDRMIGRGPTPHTPRHGTAAYDLAASAMGRYTGVPEPLMLPGGSPEVPINVGLIRDHAQPWRTVPAFIEPVGGSAQRWPRGMDPHDPAALEVDARVTGWTGPQPPPAGPARPAGPAGSAAGEAGE